MMFEYFVAVDAVHSCNVFYSKVNMCVVGCHGDSLRSLWNLPVKCIIPSCDRRSHLYPQITTHNVFFLTPWW